jgi:anti-sigma B factor antagonist
MEFTTTRKEGIQIVSIEGSLDSGTAPGAQEKLLPLVVPGCLLVLNMEKCTMISSAGLRLLLMTAKQIMKVRGRAVLTGLSEEIQDVMQMTGFEDILPSYATVAEAIAYLKGPAA